MSEFDRIEANFRLSLISQREQNSTLKQVATSLRNMATEMAGLAGKVDDVAGQGDETAERLEDSIQVMKAFAEGQAEIRKTLTECVRRLDALEGRQAS